MESEYKSIAVISLAEFPGRGGDSSNYWDMVNQLVKEGIHVKLICPRVSTTNENFEIPDGLNIIRIPFKQPRKIGKIRGPRKYIEYLLFSLIELITVYWVLRKSRIKHVIMRHSILTLQLAVLLRIMDIRIMADGELIRDTGSTKENSFFLSKLIDFCERNVIKSYAYLKVSTLGQVSDLRTRGFDEKKIALIPVSINIDKVPKHSLFEIPEHTFGYFGVLENWQGIDILIESFEILVQRIPKAILYIIGDGSLGNNLKNIVMEKGLSSNIVFIKSISREELWHVYFRKFRIVVIPRPRQNKPLDSILPIKLVESMAAGKPIVAVDLPFATDLEGSPLYLIPSAEPELLANAMESLSKNEAKMEQMRRAALNASLNFDIRINARRIIDMLIDNN